MSSGMGAALDFIRGHQGNSWAQAQAHAQAWRGQGSFRTGIRIGIRDGAAVQGLRRMQVLLCPRGTLCHSTGFTYTLNLNISNYSKP